MRCEFWRWAAGVVAALALSVDDIEGGMTVTKPTNLDPVAWALWNAHQAGAVAIRHASERDDQELDLAPYQVTFEGPLAELMSELHRSVDQLEGTSETGDRVACRILTAMARFEAEVAP